MGDATQLQQVLLNLIGSENDALQHTSQNDCRVHIQAGAERAGLRIRVSDNGPGIPAASRDQVFELFKSTKAQRMGVGLWLSRTVVDAHTGEIGFSSSPELGTCFSVWLPFHQAND